MSSQRTLSFLSCFLLFSICTDTVTAQEITGSISRVVSDSSGALIPGVKVTVTDGTGRADSWSRFDRPDLVAEQILPRGQRSENRFFNVDAFQVVREPRFGTAPRMMVNQPGLWNTDFTLLKRFRIWESLAFEIRGDFYNVFNHANWRTVDTTIRDSSNPNIGAPGTLANPYGRVNAFGEPREMQIGLKFLF